MPSDKNKNSTGISHLSSLESTPQGILFVKNKELEVEKTTFKKQNEEILNLLTTEKQKTKELEIENEQILWQLQNAEVTIESLSKTKFKNEEKIEELENEKRLLNKLIQNKEKLIKIEKWDSQWKQELKDKIIELKDSYIDYCKYNSENQNIIKETLKYKIFKFLSFGFWKSKELKNLKKEQENRSMKLDRNIEKIEKSINNFERFCDSLNKKYEQQDTDILEENNSKQSLQNLSNFHDYKEETSQMIRKRSNSF